MGTRAGEPSARSGSPAPETFEAGRIGHRRDFFLPGADSQGERQRSADLCYDWRMTKAEIDAVLDRVRTWPPERQEDAVRVLLEMEAAGTGVYELSEEELADVEEGLREIERGEVATDEEVAALFSRIRR